MLLHELDVTLVCHVTMGDNINSPQNSPLYTVSRVDVAHNLPTVAMGCICDCLDLLKAELGDPPWLHDTAAPTPGTDLYEIRFYAKVLPDPPTALYDPIGDVPIKSPYEPSILGPVNE